MHRLEEAASRLERAVMRLETITARLGGGDVQKLSSELAEARAEANKLREVNEAVVGRLDGAIERLGAVLES